MGFTGDDLTGRLMIRLVLCCRCTNCHQKYSELPLPRMRQESQAQRPEVQTNPFTSRLDHIPAQSLTGHSGQQRAGATERCLWSEPGGAEQGAHQVLAASPQWRWVRLHEWRREEWPNRNGSRGHRVNSDRRSPSLTSSSTLPCVFTSSLSSSLPHPSKLLPHQYKWVRL